MSGYPGKHCVHEILCFKLGFPTPTPLFMCSHTGRRCLPYLLTQRKQYMVSGPDGQDPGENMSAFAFFRQDAEGSFQVWSQASPTNNRESIQDSFLPQSPWRQLLKYLKIKLHFCAQSSRRKDTEERRCWQAATCVSVRKGGALVPATSTQAWLLRSTMVLTSQWGIKLYLTSIPKKTPTHFSARAIPVYWRACALMGFLVCNTWFPYLAAL